MATGGIIHALHFATHRPEPIRQSSLLMVLTAGAGTGADVISMLRSFASESKAPWSDKVKHLAILLEQGGTLADSVSVVDGLLPDESVIAIRVAEQNGNLEAILADEAVRLARISQRTDSRSALAPLFCAGATLTVAMLLVWFLMVFIIPKYKAIGEGFQVGLPDATMWLIGAWDVLFQVVVFAGLPLLILSVCGVVVYWKSHRSLLQSGRAAVFDWRPRWRTPMILRMLSLATIAQQPLDETLHAVLRVIQPGRTATRLSHTRQAISSGTNWSTALRSNGFLTQRETRFLESAALTHHEDWAMRHLAAAIERRNQQRTRRVVALLWPCLIVVTGLIVGFIAKAMFMPLIHFMQKLPTDLPVMFS